MRAALAILILLAGVTVEPVSAQVTSVRIGRVTAGSDPNGTMEGEDEYLTTDALVQYLVTYNTQGGDKLYIEFLDPTGKSVQHTPPGDPPTSKGAPATYWSLRIAGSPHAFQPGEWQVRTHWNDVLVNVTKFRISLPAESPVRLLNSTVLPAGTVGHPYYLQLTAGGGTPRYGWTAVKPFPEGLNLSREGVITGTPQKRGGFRAVVKAEDSAGNFITRSLGIAVGIPAEGLNVVSRSLRKATGTGACSTDMVETNFAASDTGIVIAMLLDADKRPGTVEWLNPRGEIAQAWDFRKTADGPECVVNTLAIAAHPAASDAGDWRVRLLWRGNEAFTLKFSIKPPAGATPSSSEGRIAFLLANRAYQKMPAAGPPDADVRGLETALRGDGFQVISKTNLTLKDLDALEKSMGAAVHPGDTVFVYYAGNGIPSGSDMWIVPVDYDPRDARPLESKAYSVLRLRDVLEDSKAKLKFLVLDTFRQGTGKGLEAAAADGSTTIVVSAESRSGAFARALAQTVERPAVTAKMALESDLPKAVAAIEPAALRPVVFIGGGGSFVFHPAK